jgi:transposase
MKCENCPVIRENERLKAENEELKGQNERLRHQLVIYKSACSQQRMQKFSSRRRRERTELRYPGRPKGYLGTTRPYPKPDRVVEANGLDICPLCKGKLGHPFRIRRRIVEELGNPQPVEVIEYEEFHYHCPTCDSEIIDRHQDCPPEGRMGKNVCIQTTLMKFDERLPERKIKCVLERQGLSITPATVLDIQRRVADWLRPEYEEVLSKVRGSDVVYTDQTGIGVDGTNHWIWDFVTNSGTLIAIRGTKGKKVLEEILGKDWRGTIVCDGSRSHHSFAKDHPGVSIQRCWAHLLTEADELAEKTKEARPLVRGLHRIYDRLKKALEEEPPPDERKKLARNAKRALKRWIDKPYRGKKVQKFIAKIRNGFDCWFTFVIKPGVEPTNNRAELALREIVVQRKIIGTLRNQKGTSIYETMMTLLTTWKQKGLNLQEALSASLSRAWARASIKRS